MPPPRKGVSANNHPVAAADLKQLFKLSDIALRLAPWEYLYESQVFGVRPLGSDGETYWVNVIGGGGEVYAVNIYRGAKGLRGLAVLSGSMIAAEEGTDYDPVAIAMEQYMYQVEFVTKVELDSWDRKAFKKGGRSLPTKRNSFAPRFLSFLPGYMPWRLEEDEGKELSAVFRTVVTALSFWEEEPDSCPDFPSKEIPVFVFGEEDGVDIKMEDAETLFGALGPDTVLVPSLDEFSLGKYRMLPVAKGADWELATSIGPSRIAEKGTRSYYPYVALVCERERGMILGTELFKKDEIGERLARTLINAMDSIGARPRAVIVDEKGLELALADWLEALGIKLEVGPCSACDEAFDGMYDALE